MSYYSSEVLADSPAGYWRMEESSGLIQDSSGNANHATATVGGGSASYQQSGAIASDSPSTAIRFNPSWLWTIPDHATLDLGNVLTLEVWLKAATNGALSAILSKKASAYEIRRTAANKIQLVMADAATFLESTQTITADGRFHHVAITKNGGAPTYYIDGVDVTPAGIQTHILLDNILEIQVGGYGAGDFNGWMDEVAIYPTALSQARVLAHYNAALSMRPFDFSKFPKSKLRRVAV